MAKKKENIIQFKISDIRMVQPICVKNKDDNDFIRLQQTESFKVHRKKYNFSSPNNVSLFVSIAKRELKTAKEIFNKIYIEKISGHSEISFNEKDIKSLFDYFEHIQTSIIFSYTAVEAFSNAAIPNSFVLEKMNNKGVKEIWNKNNIERWYSTSEKLVNILPNTLSTESPISKPFWNNFKKLENLRTELIHLKTKQKKHELESSFFKEFFHKNIFEIVESGFKAIQFYSDNYKARFFIPIELGNRKLDVIEFDDFNKYFKIKNAEK